MTVPPARETNRHGRTSWWPCDAAEHDRELNVELGEEFGPLGPYVMRVLKDLAQQQRSATVRSGFRVMRAKTFAQTTSEVRAVIERAAEIGALDDLVVDPDGRRFTCRISGLEADQARGREAIRKADQRRDMSHPDGTSAPVVPVERDMSGSVPLNRDDQNIGSGDAAAVVAPAVADHNGLHPSFDDVMALAQEAAGKDSKLIVADAAVDTMLRAYPHANHVQAARLAVADILAGSVRQPYFHKVLGWKLADQAKAPTVVDRRSEREQREAADLEAIRSLREESARVD